MNNLKEQIYERARNRVYNQVRGQVRDQVHEQVWDRLTAMIREQGFIHVRSRILLNE